MAPNVDEEMEDLNRSYMAGGNILKWSHSGKESGVFL